MGAGFMLWLTDKSERETFGIHYWELPGRNNEGGWRTLGERGVGAASFCISKGADVCKGSPRQSTGSILSNPASRWA
jgi:hypothetical protein